MATKGLPHTIADLPGLGQRAAQMLARAGISSVEPLCALDAVEAYVMARRVNHNASLNLLWALEGALSGLPWKEVARTHRTNLLLAVEERERRAG